MDSISWSPESPMAASLRLTAPMSKPIFMLMRVRYACTGYMPYGSVTKRTSGCEVPEMAHC